MAASVAIGCAAVISSASTWPAFDPGTAYAQTRSKARKDAQKQAPKEATRTPFTAEDQAAAVVPGFPDARVWGDSGADFKRVLPTTRGPWLVMSGGGADGAFSAGVLTGWTAAGNRPEFAVVTGASIGALISPYAFLGSRYDAEMRDALTTITSADIFEDRATTESFLDSWPLKRLIEKRVTPQLLAEIAAEHRRGRRLLTVTTNVDAGRRVVWDMGAIAERGGDKALKLFRDVLLASASIPGFFPPVYIDVEANGRHFQEMHLDGSITSPFFVAPEGLLEKGSRARLPASELYIIANSRLSPEFAMPDRNTISILGRLIGVALKAGLRAELLLIAANAERLGVNVNVAQVADDFQQPARGLFDHAYMQALFDYGAERGRKKSAFESVQAAAAEEQRTENPK